MNQNNCVWHHKWISRYKIKMNQITKSLYSVYYLCKYPQWKNITLLLEDGKEANNSRAKPCNSWISRLALIQPKTGVSKFVCVCVCGVCVKG